MYQFSGIKMFSIDKMQGTDARELRNIIKNLDTFRTNVMLEKRVIQQLYDVLNCKQLRRDDSTLV